MEDLYKLKLEERLNLSENPVSYNGEIHIGDITISDEHEQDCCESVQADFEVIKDYIDSINKMGYIESIRIKAVKGEGFVLFFEKEYSNIGVFIPCYNEQNGYYSDNLSLLIKQGQTVTSIDLQKAEVVNNREH